MWKYYGLEAAAPLDVICFNSGYSWMLIPVEGFFELALLLREVLLGLEPRIKNR